MFDRRPANDHGDHGELRASIVEEADGAGIATRFLQRLAENDARDERPFTYGRELRRQIRERASRLQTSAWLLPASRTLRRLTR